MIVCDWQLGMPRIDAAVEAELRVALLNGPRSLERIGPRDG